MIGAATFLVGLGPSWLATFNFRDLERRGGDFSDWIVSDAAKLNRGLWLAYARLRLGTLVLLGPVFLVTGICLLLKK